MADLKSAIQRWPYDGKSLATVPYNSKLYYIIQLPI